MTMSFVQLLVLKEVGAILPGIFVKKSVFYIRLLKVLFPVNFVGSSFSTGTSSLKTHVLSFKSLSLCLCKCVIERLREKG
jgi:hypothetical protein